MLLSAAASFAQVGRISLPFWLIMTTDWLWAVTPTADSRLRRLISHLCCSQKSWYLQEWKVTQTLHSFSIFFAFKEESSPSSPSLISLLNWERELPCALVPVVTLLRSPLDTGATNVMFMCYSCCWYSVLLGTCSDIFPGSERSFWDTKKYWDLHSRQEGDALPPSPHHCLLIKLSSQS